MPQTRDDTKHPNPNAGSAATAAPDPAVRAAPSIDPLASPSAADAAAATSVASDAPAGTFPGTPPGPQPDAATAKPADSAERFPRDIPHYDTKHSEPSWSVLGRVIAARVRAWADRAGHRAAKRTLRIGVSARIFHPEPGGKGLRGKTLQYLEESISHWVMSRDVLVFMVPTVGKQGMLHASNIRLRDYAKHLDALVLQGGADVSPQSYAEPATRPEWPGDRVRDMYELELLHEFIESGKPVLGVCRGCQLINVAFGGTLYQDIATDVPTALPHVNEEYDRLTHAIRFAEGASFAGMFGGRAEAQVNSIHHQAVDRLGRDLVVEAVSSDDGIVEAIRYQKAPFVVGVQWHPEFHRPNSDALLDCSPLLDHFLRAARETRF
ncbi:type 1 glutamine amidotransferase [Robbsia sp. KACC 23696]|uniref:gamma-glutamyl-gamma-aminobutyrate hydrolase family protein n=1 Tax=Robbsia sp. KACC 23696 TaxID=3149231 RepID=UPI00325B3408